ncbi:MAG: hypothetical protein KKG95_02125 [Candidatus Omnitrophica bacterium]|nr:hypothetical protein [Candidatus Omnitrophota bacterium]MBU1127720.1 hypothetical protein [Candidatus Omnitrophota bacterium]MBU1656742.1 hypothetical protein [Candidatus Omnitrophota bacterium]MBU1784127.1 hypothetical protein [Candidatus Omnitrophota bacterium]
MAKKKYIRKQYIILLRFQLKYIIYILLFLYVGAAVAGYTVYWTTWVTLGEKLANVYPRGRLIYIFQAANMKLLLNIMIITPFFILLGVLLSHKIAGPIYRIGKYIDSLIGGDYSKGLKLRKRDELKDLASKILELRNKLLEDREKRHKAANELIGKLEHGDVPSDVIEAAKVKIGNLID